MIQFTMGSIHGGDDSIYFMLTIKKWRNLEESECNLADITRYITCKRVRIIKPKFKIRYSMGRTGNIFRIYGNDRHKIYQLAKIFLKWLGKPDDISSLEFYKDQVKVTQEDWIK